MLLKNASEVTVSNNKLCSFDPNFKNACERTGPQHTVSSYLFSSSGLFIRTVPFWELMSFFPSLNDVYRCFCWGDLSQKFPPPAMRNRCSSIQAFFWCSIRFKVTWPNSTNNPNSYSAQIWQAVYHMRRGWVFFGFGCSKLWQRAGWNH